MTRLQNFWNFPWKKFWFCTAPKCRLPDPKAFYDLCPATILEEKQRLRKPHALFLVPVWQPLLAFIPNDMATTSQNSVSVQALTSFIYKPCSTEDAGRQAAQSLTPSDHTRVLMSCVSSNVQPQSYFALTMNKGLCRLGMSSSWYRSSVHKTFLSLLTPHTDLLRILPECICLMWSLYVMPSSLISALQNLLSCLAITQKWLLGKMRKHAK